MNTHLLAIDCQNDFCLPDGSLYVQGADGDMSRLSKMVEKMGGKLDDIHVTMDSHQILHIAHPAFWVDKDGNHPVPFTLISHDDVVNRAWSPFIEALRPWGLEYTEQLESNKRYALCIWPPHCIIGTTGHALHKDFSDAINSWAVQQKGLVDFVTKGSCLLTEHYSAVQADVVRDDDPTTQLNESVIETLAQADRILIAGEALDFCVANTIRDIAATFGDDNVKKFVLLEDACSCVNAPGLEHLGNDFVNDMKALGMQVSTTSDIM